MVELSKFFSNYSKNGYYITKNIINQNDLCDLRKDLDEELRSYNKGVCIGIEKIQNQNLLKKIIKIFASHIIIDNAQSAKNFLNQEVFLLPRFEVQKNYHVNIKEFLGWHADSGGETSYKYCKKILNDKKYFFSKVGIYLQKNGEYGGSIDIVKKTHKKTLISKIKLCFMLITRVIHKYFNNLYFALPEKIFMFFLGAKKLSPEEGSAVFFDSRLVHRGSPIEKSKLKEISFQKNLYRATVPKGKDKYSLYCHFGTSYALDSYFYDRLKRKNNSDELNIWIKQINIIKKIDGKFGEKIDQILAPIKKKYLLY